MNQMTRQQILDAILPLNEPQNEHRRLQWFIRLGYEMTISARSGYPTVQNDIKHLVAFNELQHQGNKLVINLDNAQYGPITFACSNN